MKNKFLSAISVLILFTLSYGLAQAQNSHIVKPGLPGGVIHSPARDQESSEICWAYALNGMIESEFHKGKIADGKSDNDSQSWVVLSAHYLSFYHFYFQVRNHLNDFAQLSKSVESGNIEKEVAVRRINSLLTSSSPSRNTDEDEKSGEFTPDVGSDESTALMEVSEAGLMPEIKFHSRIIDQDTETSLEKSIPNFIRDNILNKVSGRLSLYLSKVRHGHMIGQDDPLFQDMQNVFIKQLKVYARDNSGSESLLDHVPTPNETFFYRGQTYSPRTFMTQQVHFNPHRFKSFTMTLDQADEALAAIVDNLKHNYATPIGIELFDDQKPGNPKSASEMATDSGIFDDQYCTGPEPSDEQQFACHKDGGGHEMLAVNWLESSEGKITGLIVKNSWGKIGRDIDGNQLNKKDPEALKKLGFFIVTAEWLRSSANPEVNSAYDFVLHDDIALQHPNLKREWSHSPN